MFFKRIERPPDWPATEQKPFIKAAERLLLFLTCRYHIIGRENIPEPPFIVASNHLCYWDIPVMHYPFPDNTAGLSARKYQESRLSFFFSLYPVIWVSQFSADRQALRDAITLLKLGGTLALAPEGTRSRTGGLIKGTAGIAYIATRANVPIVPGVAWGQEKIMRHPRPKVTVRIGKPFRLPEGRAKSDQLEVYAERVMCAMAALLPEAYQGVYAGNPLIDEMRAIVT